MKNLLKYFIAGMFVINSCSGLKAQSNPVTRSPVYPEEFWKSKEGFKFMKGDTIYEIKNAEERLSIDGALWKILITESNHYENVESVEAENLKIKSKLQIKKEEGNLKYHFEKKIVQA